MTTTYIDNNLIYNAWIGGENGGSLEIKIGPSAIEGTNVTESIIDTAVQAFFAVVNNATEITAATKTIIAHGNDGWTWS